MINSSDSESIDIIKGSLSKEEIEKTASLLELVWPKAGLSKDYLNWLYCENPAGLAEVYNAWSNGKIVAHYAAIPITAKLFGVDEKGLLSLNIAIHPLYRGKGFFKTLASKTFDDAHSRGVNFLVGVANANSTLLFKRQLKFQLVCPLAVKIGIGSIKYSSRNTVHDYIQNWDECTLSWRLKRPDSKYTLVKRKNGVSIQGKTGRCGIWAVMHEIHSNTATLLLKSSGRWNPINLWVGLDSNCVWEKSFYINLPNRLKPSPLNFIFKDLSGLNRKLNPNNVVFSLLNFDAF